MREIHNDRAEPTEGTFFSGKAFERQGSSRHDCTARRRRSSDPFINDRLTFRHYPTDRMQIGLKIDTSSRRLLLNDARNIN